MNVRLLATSAALSLATHALAASALATQASAAEKASFIQGIYAMQGNCEAWAAAQMSDNPDNLETPVETLTEDGFHTWEGGCTFVSIDEKQKGRRWVAKMDCNEVSDEGEETDTFDLDPETGHITVTVDDNKSVFVRCDAARGN